MDEVREHPRSPFPVGPEAGKGLPDFVRGDLRVAQEAVDLVADAPGDIARQGGPDEATVFIEDRVAEEGPGARLARYHYPSPLPAPCSFYPLRGESLMRLS
jgi:hypothetical protein